MNLFKNGVGRPSNETIRKRRIFYVLVAFTIVLVLGLGTYLLANINNSSGKLKGSVSSSSSNGVELSIKYDDNSIKKITNAYYEKDIFLTNKEGKNKITLTIKNNNNYNVYYTIGKVDENGSKYIKDEINSKSSKTIDTECYIAKGVSIADSTGGDGMFDDSNCSIEVHVHRDDKQLQFMNSIIFPIYYSEKNIKVFGGGIYEDLSNDEYKNVLTGEYFGFFDIYNLNNKTIYYNWYEYNDFIDSKSTFISSGSCLSISKNNKKQISLSPVVVNESKPKQKIKIKAYSSNVACKSDKKGMNKTGVLYEEFYNLKLSEEINYNPKTDYKIFYVGNDANGVMQEQAITYGTPTKLRKNEFKKEGYTFKGWIANKIVSGKTLYYGYSSSNKAGWYEKPNKYYYYKDEQVVSKTVPAGQSVTMVAQWEKVSNSNTVTNKTSFEKGQAVTLSNTPIYSLATSKNKKTTKSGTYYVWGTSIKNGRVRIAKKKSDAGKLFKAYGWVNINDIK